MFQEGSPKYLRDEVLLKIFLFLVGTVPDEIAKSANKFPC